MILVLMGWRLKKSRDALADLLAMQKESIKTEYEGRPLMHWFSGEKSAVFLCAGPYMEIGCWRSIQGGQEGKQKSLNMKY